MTQGIIKQATNWSPTTYIGLDIPWVLFLVIWAIRRLKTRHDTTFGIIDGLILAFFAWSAVEIFNPNLSSPWMAIGAIRNRLLPMMFYWVGKDLLDGPRSQRLLLVCLLLAGAGGVFGIYEWSLNGEVGKWGPGFVTRSSTDWRDDEGVGHLRPMSIYQDGGLAAMFSGIMFCIALNSWSKFPKRIWPWIIASGLACAIFVAVSGVRSAVLCTVAGLILSVLLNRRLLRPVLGIFFIFMLLSTITGSANLGDRYKTIVNPLAAYQENRGHTVKAAGNLIQTAPLGIGTGSATTSAAVYVNLFDPGNKQVDSYQSDNAIAVMLAEGGILLMILYVAIFSFIIAQSWKECRKGQSKKEIASTVLVLAVVLLIASGTGPVTDWQPTNILLWILAGSLMAAPIKTAYQKSGVVL